MSTPRPDPEALLARVQREAKAAARGKLRIFFGPSAGAGKTYAMLLAARRAREEGRDVIVGLVETHGRAETQALLEGLELLPRQALDHKGRELRDFDIDGALARKPQLVLVDELAHTNAPGSRHPKRWQDVAELLGAGIDVFTTLNVQHLDSLNDVVGGITGIRVWETVPDSFFDQADEVILVDVPPEELLKRLKEGKVYLPQQAERAAANFFRKGNLIALRELALRRTADVVEGDVRRYRADKSIEGVWKTQSRLLCCVGPRPGAEQVVRAAARLAQRLDAEWRAVYVETPRLQRVAAAERDRILRVLKLAQDLGAQTQVLTGNDVAPALVAHARDENIGTVVVGRDPRRRLPWRRTLSDAIAAGGEDLDVVEIGRGTREAGAPVPARPIVETLQADPKARERRLRYVGTLAACAVATFVAALLAPYFELANIVMVFMLSVVLVGMRWGRGPAVAAAVINVLAFDFFFVPPRYTLAVSDVQYLLTFGVMLAVGLIVGQLTAGMRYQALVAGHRESRARTLYEFARDLSGLLTPDQVVETGEAFMGRAFRAKVAILLPDEHGRLSGMTHDVMRNPMDWAAAQWAFDHTQPAGAGTDTLPGNDWLFLPLKAPMRTRGILAIRPERSRELMIPEQMRQYETFAALAAIALERVHYVDVARDALIKIESERLRNSLLAALSHDLRTPLAALLGLSETMALTRPPMSPEQVDIARTIGDETKRLIALVNNLLDMARIQSGEVRLDLQWHPLEEVVGSALAASRAALGPRQVAVDIPRDLPLVQMDAVLMERVLANLLENAGKYTQPDARVAISAHALEGEIEIAVEDDGPGIPAGQEEAVFEKFARGASESATPGVGLGLAICRAIVEAHRGSVVAEIGRARGARFVIRLPRGEPPEVKAA
ncbi:MAG TPA: two-component system sensor histidine kinase KdpD [Usitatibacter sp.]|jgi:two-component system sensor histidine kinase KdpD|nr:two-component system sensor histidine kinase KdpD [Usitatibacter sp.]